MKKKIEIGVYYTEDDKGEKLMDEESMREEFEEKLAELGGESKECGNCGKPATHSAGGINRCERCNDL